MSILCSIGSFSVSGSRLSQIFCTVALTCLLACFASQSTFAQSKAEAGSAVISMKVNINSAGAEEISEMLIGVGLKKAKAIVDFRKENGVFATVEDITLVKGIGKSTLEKNRGRIMI